MTDAPAPRRRAPGMSPERRREMIIDVAIPLIAQHGTAITTSQVAQAAGIGEATIFRVFRDKEELIDACLVEAMRPDNVIDGIASIALDQPLADRLVEAADTMSAHLSRMGSVIGALHTSGRPARRDPSVQPDPNARENSTRATVQAITALFEPDVDQLRLPVEQVAALFLGQLYSRTRPLAGAEMTPAESVDLFLNGALRSAA